MSDDEKFLLSIVDNPHSDYDDGLDGYPNFTVHNGNLKVSFYDPETNETLTGVWSLDLIGIETKSGDK